ncbi:unnamed protein product [Acanthoscelides obtectus]|uniref:Large ribosomal subunit protein bL21m n=1 Tax=Acanthoscelides obtectus TaxID=200917 RepID=A0A9P0LDZ4_ACAOB|nr:unnamed protein product [Acanthoscelides obtectus]CAK1663084.1 39S ribosomal protein L21, mitochondrial [Acanthoscelides obtectus]
MGTLLRQIIKNCEHLSRLSISNNLLKPGNSPLLALIATKRYSNVPTPYEVVDIKAEEKSNKEVINQVNQLVKDNNISRLFAVVHVTGKQFKITEGDVIVIEGYWPPTVGDKILLDKVLLAGSTDFTLIGRPIVQKGLVRVEATVIEKTLSHTKTHFRKKRRKQYMRINFFRIQQTYLRINKVCINGEVNNPPEVRGLETAIF